MVARSDTLGELLPVAVYSSIDMNWLRRGVILGLLLCGPLGCGRVHFRPKGVPSSAVWVDHTFIECSVEGDSRSNHCTVYKDDSGQVLAEGQFMLKNTHGQADPSELHYVAYGNTSILLADAHELLQISASPRDPSHHIFADRLRTLASHGGSAPIECGAPNATEAPAQCALKAFADKRPFFVRWYFPSTDHFSYSGIAMDSSDAVWSAFYVGGKGYWITVRMPGADLPPPPLDDGHTVVSPCPMPIVLTEDARGVLSCEKPRR
jgi:hypothetical protein